MSRTATDMTFRPPSHSHSEERPQRSSRPPAPEPVKQEISSRLEVRPEQPLGFSFGPQPNTDKDKKAQEMLDQINHLSRELSEKKKEL